MIKSETAGYIGVSVVKSGENSAKSEEILVGEVVTKWYTSVGGRWCEWEWLFKESVEFERW